MKLKHLFLILLAFCTVFFLTGCDSGGSSSSSDDNGGSSTSNTYVLSNNTDDSAFEITVGTVTQVSGGIRYTRVGSGDTIEMLQTITLDSDSNTFTWYIKTTDITTSTVESNLTYSGTMVLSGSTLTLTTNKEKNNDTSVETAVGPWDDTFTVSSSAIVEGTITFSKQ